MDYSDNISSSDLAYLGDAVIEVMVRERLVKNGHCKGEHLSDLALSFVTAKAQSDAFANIEASLTDEETDVFHRARNNFHTSNVPKSATPMQYRRATGFEALFAHLWLKGDTERLKELFNMAYPEK